MRLLAALLAWLLAFALAGADALILIQPGLAESPPPPQLRPAGWVVWPPVVYPQGHTDLLALVTGKDWLGDNFDSRFSTLGDGKLREDDGPEMAAWGYFDARRQFLNGLRLYALAGPERSFRETELLLCVDGPKTPVPTLDPRDHWPPNALIVRDASSWADVLAVAIRVRRTLVVEYPPPPNRPWTRLWLAGSWPEDSGPINSLEPQSPIPPGSARPGALPARFTLDLLRKPESFTWKVPSDPSTWLTDVRLQAPLWLTGLGSLLALCVAVGLGLALRERHSGILPQLLLILLLCPAAAVLSGSFLPSRLALALAALYGVSRLGQWAQARWLPHAQRLLAPSLLSLIAFSCTNPLLSVLSGEFRSASGFPAAAFGCLFASLVGTCAFLRGSTLLGELLARLATLALCVAWFGDHAWWSPGPWPCALAPLVAMLVGEGVWRVSWSPALPLLGALTTPGLLYGIAWDPLGLLAHSSDKNKLNGADYVVFFLSPLFVGTCAMVFFFSLIADRFLLHQYRRLVADDPRRLAVLSGAGTLGLLGLFQPLLLTSALWCAVAGLAILVLEGVEVL